MNITMEQVEKLREYANVSYKEAREALEASGGDILQAVIELEKQGKTAAPAGGSYSTRDGAGQADAGQNGGNAAGGNCNKGGSGWQGGVYVVDVDSKAEGSSFGDLMRKLWAGFCRLLHKGNTNRFEVSRREEVMLSVPVTILVVALLFFFWITLPLLVVGLFFSCKYRFRGPDLEKEVINKAMDSAAETAESIKRAVNEDTQN